MIPDFCNVHFYSTEPFILAEHHYSCQPWLLYLQRPTNWHLQADVWQFSGGGGLVRTCVSRVSTFAVWKLWSGCFGNSGDMSLLLWMQLLNCTIAPRFTIVLIFIEMSATIQALWFEIFYVTPSSAYTLFVRPTIWLSLFWRLLINLFCSC